MAFSLNPTLGWFTCCWLLVGEVLDIRCLLGGLVVGLVVFKVGNKQILGGLGSIQARFTAPCHGSNNVVQDIHNINTTGFRSLD